MFINRHFQHDLIRKNIILFGTLFNNIYITRPENQAFKIPIEYGPREKWLAIVQAKPKHKKQAIILPRMSYELTGMSYDTTRKTNRSNIVWSEDGKQIYKGSPWNINFELNVMSNSNSDMTKIIEQIFMYFDPDYTVDVKFIDDFDHLDRVTTVYNSVQHEDRYEGSFMDRRAIIWTFNYTMKTYLYGPIENIAPIKYVDVRIHPSDDINTHGSRIVTQPGLTIDGKPTNDINETINYQEINFEDDWGIISEITEGWNPND